jgi:hypothetical protein
LLFDLAQRLEDLWSLNLGDWPITELCDREAISHGFFSNVAGASFSAVNFTISSSATALKVFRRDIWAVRRSLFGSIDGSTPLDSNFFAASRLMRASVSEIIGHWPSAKVHLRRVLRSYARYYNDIRTHWSLDKDAPVSRPVQRTGSISSPAILGGLHHHYVRV